MLKNTLINRIATKTIAGALKELNDRVIYVGGAVVSLYIDDPAADDVRPTQDIDISLNIASLTELELIRESLINQDFHQTSDDDVICRFRYNDIKVDIMATEAIGWEPGNEWFKAGFDKRQKMVVDEYSIHVLPLAYFLATKFSAFQDRGMKDPRTSTDFEDIVYLLNHTSNVKEQVVNGSEDVKVFLKEWFAKIIESDDLQEAILGHLYYEEQMVRSEKIITDLKEIIDAI